MININNITITEELLNSICKIELFRGAWSFMTKDKDSLMTILRAQAKIASTGSSSRIEGSLLKDYEVEKVLAGVSSPSFRQRDVREARGYARALSLINDDYEVMQLSEQEIKNLHSILISDKTRDEYRKTAKPEQNILSDEPTIENASALDAPAMLDELIARTNTQIKSEMYHPLLIAAVFMENFLSINPFGEGNGRMARLLSMLILLKKGYYFISYYPFETIFEETRKSYLTALKKSQSQNDSDSWLSYFVKVFEKVSLRLSSRIMRDNSTSEEDRYINLSPIERDILKCILDRDSIYTTELIALLPNYKVPTLKKALKSLVEKKELAMLGVGRGTYYKDIEKLSHTDDMGANPKS